MFKRCRAAPFLSLAKVSRQSLRYGFVLATKETIRSNYISSLTCVFAFRELYLNALLNSMKDYVSSMQMNSRFNKLATNIR